MAKQTFSAINKKGQTIRADVTGPDSFGEYKTKFFVNGIHQKDADYFTDDKSDATGTAQAEIRRMAQF